MVFSPIILSRIFLISSFLVWAVPVTSWNIAERVHTDLPPSDWWRPCVFFISIFLEIGLLKALLRYLRNAVEDSPPPKVIIVLTLLFLVLAYIPIYKIIDAGFVRPIETPEWINWSYGFISFFCLNILAIEIKQFSLLKNYPRIFGYSLSLFFFWLSFLYMFFHSLIMYEVSDVLEGIGGWLHVALLLVFISTILDVRTSFKRGKLYPLCFFLFFWTYTSNLLPNISYGLIPYVSLPDNVRVAMYKYFPTTSEWLSDRYIIGWLERDTGSSYEMRYDW